jgi:2-phospho-L-lactate guanylyltransferase
MSLWAIVPVKPLRRGKSRLAGVLSEDMREELNRRMLGDTVKVLQEVEAIEHALVVSRDPAALALAREHGARTLLEDGSPELNVALARAAMLALAHKAHGVLVIPADLPLLNAEDVRAMIELTKPSPSVVIAPDHKREGTNALLLSPPDVIPFEYGPRSFERHVSRALEAGALLEICTLDSLMLDMDLPQDLDLLDENLRMEIGALPELEEWGGGD